MEKAPIIEGYIDKVGYRMEKYIFKLKPFLFQHFFVRSHRIQPLKINFLGAGIKSFCLLTLKFCYCIKLSSVVLYVLDDKD